MGTRRRQMPRSRPQNNQQTVVGFTKGSIVNTIAILGVLASIFAAYYGLKGGADKQDQTLALHGEAIAKTFSKVDTLQAGIADLNTKTEVAKTKQDYMSSQIDRIVSGIKRK